MPFTPATRRYIYASIQMYTLPHYRSRSWSRWDWSRTCGPVAQQTEYGVRSSCCSPSQWLVGRRTIRCAIYYWTIVWAQCRRLDACDLPSKYCCFHCYRCHDFCLDFHLPTSVFSHYSMICHSEKDPTKIHFLCYVAMIYGVDDDALNCHDFSCTLSGKLTRSLRLDQCCQLSCVHVHLIDGLKKGLWVERKKRTDLVGLSMNNSNISKICGSFIANNINHRKNLTILDTICTLTIAVQSIFDWRFVFI